MKKQGIIKNSQFLNLVLSLQDRDYCWNLTYMTKQQRLALYSEYAVAEDYWKGANDPCGYEG